MIRATVRNVFDFLRGRGQLAALVALLVVAAGVWGFVELADAVMEGETQHFDEWAVRAPREPANPAEFRGPGWIEEVARDMTALGGVAFLTLATAAVAGHLWMVRKHHAMWLVLAATGGGLVLSTVLKYSFGRDRPDIVPHASKVYTSSFPSGHSMLAAVVYLTLGSLLIRLVPRRAVKIYLLTIAVLVTLLVGVSRVYMGVHYPTDVLAGWTAGAVWAVVCWSVARKLQIRGAVEKDVEGAGASPAPSGT